MPQRLDIARTAGPVTVIDRVTPIVSDLDLAEDDYVKTFGFSIEQRGDIDPSLAQRPSAMARSRPRA